MSNQENPEIVDTEKTIEQLVGEINERVVSLSQEIAELRKGVEEAKALPETQGAKKTLENIESFGTSAKATLSAIVQDAKSATEARATADKCSAEVEIILKASKAREEEGRQIQEDIEKDLNDVKAKLHDLIEESTKTIKEEHEKIEKIIPGAITAKLASSFKNRKDDISKYGWVWTLLLVASSLGLVSVGIVSIVKPGDHFWSTLPARAIVVVGLLFIEEFARRNYNIKFKLSEAYAYREALAELFYGYRSEIKGMKIKDVSNSQQEIDAEKRLVEIFMDELSEEPEAQIFDKERSSSVTERILEKVTDSQAEESMVSKVADGNLLAKVSWPIVVVCAIIMIGSILIAYINK
jgi:hypothetical protein